MLTACCLAHRTPLKVSAEEHKHPENDLCPSSWRLLVGGACLFPGCFEGDPLRTNSFLTPPGLVFREDFSVSLSVGTLPGLMGGAFRQQTCVNDVDFAVTALTQSTPST